MATAATPSARASRPAPGTVVLRTAGLTKRFGPILAVDNLDIEVRAGEVFGFLGPNGSGKSTTAGEVRIESGGLDHGADAFRQEHHGRHDPRSDRADRRPR
jgi:ABC-type branched-subunit amino acid transport system ATPase component